MTEQTDRKEETPDILDPDHRFEVLHRRVDKLRTELRDAKRKLEILRAQTTDLVLQSAKRANLRADLKAEREKLDRTWESTSENAHRRTVLDPDAK